MDDAISSQATQETVSSQTSLYCQVFIDLGMRGGQLHCQPPVVQRKGELQARVQMIENITLMITQRLMDHQTKNAETWAQLQR